MCGIAGIISNDQSDLDLLEVMTDSLSHRGPDNRGFFRDGTVGIGHRRLSIIDLSEAANQPMQNEDGSIQLICNGEIYNFRELRAQLEEKGYIFHGNSDTEVLLNLYLSEGKAMLSKLNGIFAFAIWDANYETLFVARDALGVKPLYYFEKEGIFTFASEIKALLELTHIDKELDIEAINRYLTFLWCPGKETPLISVIKLLPGEALIVGQGKIKEKWQWYQLPIFRITENNLSKNDAIKGVEFHLRQAVQRQMVADVPLGAFLSGGLDSSAVVTFARELNPDIRCFSIETKDVRLISVVL